MAKRYSMLSGRIEEIPDAPAKSAAPDLSAQIADLRVQLATAQAQLEAARAECASLAGRLADEVAECCALRDRPPTVIQQPAPAPAQLPAPAAPRPTAYDVQVIRRDEDGRLVKLQLTPTRVVPL